MLVDHKLKVVFHWIPGQQLHPMYWWSQLFVLHRTEIEYFCEKSICLTPYSRLYALPTQLESSVLSEYTHVLILRDPYERVEDLLIEMMDHPEGARFFNTRNLNSLDEIVRYLIKHPDELERDGKRLPWFRTQRQWVNALKGLKIVAVEYADLAFQLSSVLLRLGYDSAPQYRWESKPIRQDWKIFTELFFAEDLALFGLQAEIKDIPQTTTDNVCQSSLHPLVSVVTPTFKRTAFLPLLQDGLLHQTYPLDRIEWIIIDDSPEGYPDFVPDKRLNVRYIRLHEKMVLGDKRNLCCRTATGSIVIPCDDDDYMPPTRIQHAVDVLQSHPSAMFAYAQHIPMYDLTTNQLIVTEVHSPQYSLGAAWAFKKLLTEAREYASNAYAEEFGFIDRHVPYAILDGFQTLLSFAHTNNTASRERTFKNTIPSDRPIESLIDRETLDRYRSASTSST